MFIVFEGIDGCGKTTHAKDLASWLEEKDVDTILTAEPTKSRIGRFIREVLAGKEVVDPTTLALLFTADRMEHLEKKIKPAIAEDKHVICERYYYSTIAYQNAQGVDWNWLFEINKHAVKPDIIILLDVNAEQGADRTTTGEIFEKQEFLKKVRDNYMKFPEMHKIKTNRPKKEVQEDIRKIISKKL